ncbi:hypothetical protein Q8W15_14075 [Photobacterium damselae subsp. piscicida]|uniref:Cytosine permease n=1 Tax=Photobacterium damsela subsp. piscicida TaxID=38294 RepID=A0A7L8A903_PHODP|nr:hypothetical protein [Photobacterium damselae]MBE8126922.1 hypothetical protein [Photobacterium damselae subsp. piscicida]MDP2516155.1 hypothetical protein [Photobacterium damselae subsp. piscicida]MDP2531731.1 hypothetical protein [Photobacterium damselae subsp. piscicida]MDP2543210.1 hypothetical protein [Photobacterium damselae subsp. piscicida]MDP2558102.1 hypothetical protein [Photobacterium damselae subsp. piscicida]
MGSLPKQGYTEQELYGDTGVNKPTLACWLIGSLSGLMVSKTGFIDGPFAIGVFADSSLGLFISFAVAMVLYRVVLISKKAC